LTLAVNILTPVVNIREHCVWREPDKSALAEHLRGVVERRLIDPLEILLERPLTVTPVRDHIARKAECWATDLLGDDEPVAVATAARLIAALYPSDGPFDPPAEWWRTPLGQVVVARVGHPFAEAVPYSVAGAMLGVTRQFVHNLVSRGRLDRHPDGGVTVASVRARLLRYRDGGPHTEDGPWT
jgi:hypothetical protein